MIFKRLIFRDIEVVRCLVADDDFHFLPLRSREIIFLTSTAGRVEIRGADGQLMFRTRHQVEDSLIEQTRFTEPDQRCD